MARQRGIARSRKHAKFTLIRPATFALIPMSVNEDIGEEQGLFRPGCNQPSHVFASCRAAFQAG